MSTVNNHDGNIWFGFDTVISYSMSKIAKDDNSPGEFKALERLLGRI